MSGLQPPDEAMRQRQLALLEEIRQLLEDLADGSGLRGLRELSLRQRVAVSLFPGIASNADNDGDFMHDAARAFEVADYIIRTTDEEPSPQHVGLLDPSVIP